MSVQPTLGRILKDLRSHRGWTLKEMSARSGIPVSTLSKVEHDRLTLTYDKLLQLSQKLNIRISELFAEFERTPHAAGSLGQVHRARHHDGTPLAVKIRRPNIVREIERDLADPLGDDLVARLDDDVEVRNQHLLRLGRVSPGRDHVERGC